MVAASCTAAAIAGSRPVRQPATTLAARHAAADDAGRASSDRAELPLSRAGPSTQSPPTRPCHAEPAKRHGIQKHAYHGSCLGCRILPPAVTSFTIAAVAAAAASVTITVTTTANSSAAPQQRPLFASSSISSSTHQYHNNSNRHTLWQGPEKARMQTGSASCWRAARNATAAKAETTPGPTTPRTPSSLQQSLYGVALCQTMRCQPCAESVCNSITHIVVKISRLSDILLSCHGGRGDVC